MRRVWLVIVILGAAPALAAGQEPLTLDAAVRAALSRNPAVRAAAASTAEASARQWEARSGFWPRLTVSEGWQRSNQPVFAFSSLLSARQFTQANFAIDALNRPDPQSFFRTSVGLEQTLFDGGRQRAMLREADGRRDIAGFAADETSAAVALQTTEAFVRVLSAQAAERAAAAGLMSAREDLARAERRRDAGTITDADVLALTVHVADLEQQQVQARGDAAVAAAELNRLMGAPIDGAMALAEPSGGAAETLPPLAALLAEAERARPELKRAEAWSAVAEAGRRQAGSALLPRVTATALVDWSGTRIDERASGWLFGGVASWSLSTGGAELAQRRAAAQAAVRARAEQDAARAAVQTDVLSASTRLASARARLTLGTATVQQAREAQRITRDRFDAGLAPTNDVLQASSALLAAEARRASALGDLVLAEAAFRRALGRAPLP